MTLIVSYKAKLATDLHHKMLFILLAFLQLVHGDLFPSTEMCSNALNIVNCETDNDCNASCKTAVCQETAASKLDSSSTSMAIINLSKDVGPVNLMNENI